MNASKNQRNFKEQFLIQLEKFLDKFFDNFRFTIRCSMIYGLSFLALEVFNMFPTEKGTLGAAYLIMVAAMQLMIMTIESLLVLGKILRNFFNP